MGANLSDLWSRGISSGTPWTRRKRQACETAKTSRRFVGGSTTTSCRGRLPKKLARLSVGAGTPREKTQVISTLRHKHKLEILLEVAKLPRATYYYHAKRLAALDKYATVKAEIRTIYAENKGRYGYRRITDVLHNRGFFVNRKAVQRLMKVLGLVCKMRMKKYKSYKGEVGKIAPNLLERNFEADKPNQKCVTDVTEFSLFGQKLYLSPILDLHSRDIVNYTIYDRPALNMVTEMLSKAFEKIPNGTNLILHSDQGWHYQHKQYQRMLKARGIVSTTP